VQFIIEEDLIGFIALELEFGDGRACIVENSLIPPCFSGNVRGSFPAIPRDIS
jgi:hypothetical protein